jgi:hypothetical protein
LEKRYEGNFVVQRLLQQHSEMAALNESSINTLRIMTVQLDEPRVLSTVLRSGRAGSVVDNQTAEGISCGVTPEGRINAWAVDRFGNRILAHPDSGYRYGGQRVPGIAKAWELVAQLQRQLLYYDLASWDIAIGPAAEPVLIEVNLRWQGVNLHQMNNGPLFGDLTEEVLRHVRERRARGWR